MSAALRLSRPSGGSGDYGLGFGGLRSGLGPKGPQEFG